MKATKQQLADQAELKDKEATLYMLALHDVINGGVQNVGFYKNNDERYTFQASRLDKPNGGLFMISFSCKGQSISTSVSYLDDVYTSAQQGCSGSPESLARQQAIFRAVSLRGDMLNG